MLKQLQPSTATRQGTIIGAFVAVTILLVAQHRGSLPKSAWFRINVNMSGAAAAATSDNLSSIGPATDQQQPSEESVQMPRSGNHDQKATVTAAPYVPEMLSSMLVCITFKWNALKLVHLTTVLQTLATYRTSVDILIVTDKATLLKVALHGMSNTLIPQIQQVEVWQPDKSYGNEQLQATGRFWLTYQHRYAIEWKLKQKDYSTVMYIEDDTYIPWSAVVSWALDTQLLQPLNFTRCFYRTEVHHLTGTKVLLDWEMKENFTEVATVDVKLIDSHSRARYMALSQQLQRKSCEQSASGVVQPCSDSMHRHFLSPSFPFQGMWMLNRQQLSEFMHHPYWAHDASVKADLGPKHNFWGYPERSNSLHIFLHVPKGYGTTCMVPYIPAGESSTEVAGSNSTGSVVSTEVNAPPTWLVKSRGQPKLPAIAEVKHLRNAYGTVDCIPSSNERAKCAKNKPDVGHFTLSSIPVDDAFVQ